MGGGPLHQAADARGRAGAVLPAAHDAERRRPRQRCEIDTSDFAWADNDPATIGTRYEVEVELIPAGQAAQKQTKPFTVRPRPVIFVPGIGGNYAKNVSAEGDLFWLLNRGVEPGLLEIDPLIRSYNGLLRTLFNTGYTPGRDLFITNYDWRLVPGPSDNVYDGVITGLTPAGISDTTYQHGVDYLGETLRVAAEVWASAYQAPLDSVDVIAHSTGGLVTRTYIQSTAYGGEYATSKKLPRVKNFISVGVPHCGASKAWNPLHDNWGIDSSFRVVLSKLVILRHDDHVVVVGDAPAHLARLTVDMFPAIADVYAELREQGRA